MKLLIYFYLNFVFGAGSWIEVCILNFDRKNKKIAKKYACLCQIRSFFASCFLISRNANCYCSLHTFCLLQYKSFFFLFSVGDNILYNPALLLQRLLQRIQSETLLRLMQQDKSISGCLISPSTLEKKIL